MPQKCSLLIIVVFFAQLSHAKSQVLDILSGVTIPNARSCIARNILTGQFVEARQKIGMIPAWAYATWDFDGTPLITYGQAYFQLPTIMKIFTTTHECGHLKMETSNEFSANCFALQNSGLSPDEKNFVAQFHNSIGIVGPQYGGSGMAFWQGTTQLCPESVQ